MVLSWQASSQEEGIRIGPVYAHVAGGAVLVARVVHVMARRFGEKAGALASQTLGAVVAFQGKGENERPAEQARVHGAMRVMTGLTAFRAHGGVLEKKGAAFFRVALQAGLLVCERLLHHARTGCHAPCWREGPMRVVAIRAGHESFIDAVLER